MSGGDIDKFSDEYRFLSNFWQVRICFEGVWYPSTEHAFQAAKTLDLERRRRIADLPTSSAAKKAGREVVLRADWETVKLLVMEEILRLKFAHRDLAEKLLATGERGALSRATGGVTSSGAYATESATTTSASCS